MGGGEHEAPGKDGVFSLSNSHLQNSSFLFGKSYIWFGLLIGI